jgi:hypothetical protein
VTGDVVKIVNLENEGAAVNVTHALDLVQRVTYKDWEFAAEPYDRYDDTVMLTVSFDAPDTSAPAGDDRLFRQVQRFYLHVADCLTDVDFHAMVIHCVVHFELHELREVYACGEARPFHAHTTEGIRNWLGRRPLRTQDDLADVTIVTHR